MSQTITAVIIEDEENSYILLKRTLEEYCDNIEVVGHAKSIKEGRKLLSNATYDVVFMDVELQDGKSFKILEMLSNKDFQLIFTTAYDQYAIKAIKYGAIDYLLKPYNPDEVVHAINRVRERLINPIPQPSLKSNMRVKLNTKEGIEVVNKEDIYYCGADGSYTVLYMKDDRKVILSKTLKELEKLEEFNDFERIHSSYLINLQHVQRFIKTDGGWVQLSNGKELPVSRRKRQEFLERL